jgi:hypothetical protein
MNDATRSTVGRMRDALAVRDRRSAPIRWSTEREFLGLPIVDIAVGKDATRGEPGHAKGVVAIGDRATGLIAVGVHARGLVAVGVTAVGGLAVGWLALGAFAIGGLVGGLVALGGGAVGVFAIGGAALGVIAIGAAAAGNFAAGFTAIGEHVYTRAIHDPEVLNAIAAFWGIPPR